MLTPTQRLVLDRVEARQRLCRRIKEVITERMELDIDPEWITDDQPIFGRGMELDSLDAIEVVVGIESVFKVSLIDDEMSTFGSVNALADHLERQRES